MKTTHYDERELTESLNGHAGPALVWAALFAFFAIAGVSSHDESRQMANAAPALQVMADETADGPAMGVSTPSAGELELRDAAVVVHEALDPVGVGRNTTP